MIANIFVDVVGSYRDWLRTQTQLTNLVGRRIFLGLPERGRNSNQTFADDESNFPCINVFEVSSVPQAGMQIVDAARLQFDCWGVLKPAKSRLACSNARLALKNLLAGVHSGVLLRPGVKAAECSQITDLWFPDPVTDRPRYCVTAVCYATPT